MSRMMVNAIQEYYNQQGLAEHYMVMSQDPTLDAQEELSRLAEKHIQLAAISLDYILTNFKMELEGSSSSIKDHLNNIPETAH